MLRSPEVSCTGVWTVQVSGLGIHGFYRIGKGAYEPESFDGSRSNAGKRASPGESFRHLCVVSRVGAQNHPPRSHSMAALTW